MRRLGLEIMILVFFLYVEGLQAQEKTMFRKVVIDAGHGGKDPGTIGRKVQEKEVTLAIALKLGRLIRDGCEDVKVIYTRDKDEFIELFERAEIANRNKADLFISIHCNSNRSHSFQGAETYVMGLHKSQQNLEISKLENASILMEPDYKSKYDGFDPNSDESYITFTLFQNAYLQQSTEFAAEVQNALKDRVGLDDRGVRQAGFLVLYKTTMPSVLVETGFLSNPVEESYLISNTGQEHIANAIYKAFLSFKNKIEKSDNNLTTKATTQPDEEKPLQVVAKPTPEKKDLEKLSNPDASEIRFRIQIAVYPNNIGITDPKFKKLKEVRVYHQDGTYKYTTGNERDLASAFKLLEEIRNKGYQDAFLVAFKGDERISIEDAKRLLQEKGNK